MPPRHPIHQIMPDGQGRPSTLRLFGRASSVTDFTLSQPFTGSEPEPKPNKIATRLFRTSTRRTRSGACGPRRAAASLRPRGSDERGAGVADRRHLAEPTSRSGCPPTPPGVPGPVEDRGDAYVLALALRGESGVAPHRAQGRQLALRPFPRLRSRLPPDLALHIFDLHPAAVPARSGRAAQTVAEPVPTPASRNESLVVLRSQMRSLTPQGCSSGISRCQVREKFAVTEGVAHPWRQCARAHYSPANSNACARQRSTPRSRHRRTVGPGWPPRPAERGGTSRGLDSWGHPQFVSRPGRAGCG